MCPLSWGWAAGFSMADRVPIIAYGRQRAGGHEMTLGTDASGWVQDPTGRHELRYHDGLAFTRYVSDSGAVSVDTSSEGMPTSDDPAPVPAIAAPGSLQPRAVTPAPTVPTYTDGYVWPATPYAPAAAQWGFTSSVAAPAKRARHRNGLSLAVGVAALEAIAIVVLSVALVANHSTAASPIGSTVPPSGSFTEQMGQVVYSSTFGASQGWTVGSVNANTTITLTNGQYRVTGWTAIHHALTTPYGVPQRGMSVAANATGYPAGNVSMGVGCQSAYGISSAVVYQLVAYPDGQWYIEEARIPGNVKPLLSGETGPLGAATALQLTCVDTDATSGSETTQLVAYVNGDEVGAIGDRVDQQGGGYVPILVLGTFGPQVSTTFTSFTVRKIDPPA